MVPRPPARGRHGPDLRPHLELDDARLWGPRARDIMRELTSADMSHEGFPFATCRDIEMGPLRVLASRISYVGDLGWELYVPIEQGARLWDMAEAGEPHGIVPAGIGVYGTTGRLEKCYRAFGFELDGEYNVVEAGMAGARSRTRTSWARRRTCATARRTRDGDVHAHGGRPHLGQRRQALHARRRADRHARRRAARGLARAALVRDERRRGRRWASTSCSRTCRPSTRTWARSSPWST